MKFTIHIRYSDGSNPFLSLSGWSKARVVNEAYFQIQKNRNSIACIDIYPYGEIKCPMIIWRKSTNRWLIYSDVYTSTCMDCESLENQVKEAWDAMSDMERNAYDNDFDFYMSDVWFCLCIE